MAESEQLANLLLDTQELLLRAATALSAKTSLVGDRALTLDLAHKDLTQEQATFIRDLQEGATPNLALNPENGRMARACIQAGYAEIQQFLPWPDEAFKMFLNDEWVAHSNDRDYHVKGCLACLNAVDKKDRPEAMMRLAEKITILAQAGNVGQKKIDGVFCTDPAVLSESITFKSKSEKASELEELIQSLKLQPDGERSQLSVDTII